MIAVKNSTGSPLKLTPDGPDLFREMIDDKEKPLNIESIKKLHSEGSDSTGLIPPGAVFYYAVAYPTPVLGAHQRIRISLGQTNAADEPASIILASSEK